MELRFPLLVPLGRSAIYASPPHVREVIDALAQEERALSSFLVQQLRGRVSLDRRKICKTKEVGQNTNMEG